MHQHLYCAQSPTREVREVLAGPQALVSESATYWTIASDFNIDLLPGRKPMQEEAGFRKCQERTCQHYPTASPELPPIA